MNLSLANEIYAGGPGSGCRGENCGRPGSDKLKEAVELATKAHAGQKDKTGHPYIDHPMRVMEAVKGHGEVAQIAAVLHDVVEDTPTTLDEIRDKFGVAVAEAVDAVSQRKGEPYFDYVKRAAQNPLAKEIKKADIADNLRPDRSLGRNMESLRQKYTKALKILQ